MPELSAIHLGLLIVTLLSGLVLGWITRGNRATREKIAVNAGWQEQLESQQAEHQRLAEQNKSLMEQISRYQNNSRESAERLKAMKVTLDESYKLRDQLQQQLKEFGAGLKSATEQRDRFRSACDEIELRLHSTMGVLDQKDEKIARLKKELRNWADRLPPLVEKFKTQGSVIDQLRSDLAEAEAQIGELRKTDFGGETRIEPVSATALPEGMDASNEPHSEAAAPGKPSWREGRPNIPSRDSKSNSAMSTPAAPPPIPRQAPSGNGFERPDSKTASPSPPADDAADDLKRIKGIGPAIEKTLNELGIARFDQIAEISEVDIDRIAQHMKGFRSRIYREDWLGQARDLHVQKHKNPN